LTGEKLAAFQVPGERLPWLRGLDADKMHEHLLHQVFLSIRIRRHFRGYFLQLFHNQILSHRYTLPVHTFWLRHKTGRTGPVFDLRLHSKLLQVGHFISARYANKIMALQVTIIRRCNPRLMCGLRIFELISREEFAWFPADEVSA